MGCGRAEPKCAAEFVAADWTGEAGCVLICVRESVNEGSRGGGKVCRGGMDKGPGDGGVVGRNAEGGVCVRRVFDETAGDPWCVG